MYKHNIQEVLEIETGHMVGLFEQVLPELRAGHQPTVRYLPATKAELECAEEDYYLGTFELVPHGAARPRLGNRFEIYIQAHPGRIADVPAGQYLYQNGVLRRISDELILKKHVIAINQQVYERASLGITVISRTRKNWMSYVDLGRKLQHFEMNDINLGFMSSGYSSRTGYDLPSAKRIDSILEAASESTAPSYFFVGGRMSDEQPPARHEGGHRAHAGSGGDDQGRSRRPSARLHGAEPGHRARPVAAHGERQDRPRARWTSRTRPTWPVRAAVRRAEDGTEVRSAALRSRQMKGTASPCTTTSSSPAGTR